MRLVQVLQPIQERRASFTEAQVKEILKDGSSRARPRAEATMRQVRAAMQMTGGDRKAEDRGRAIGGSEPNAA